MINADGSLQESKAGWGAAVRGEDDEILADRFACDILETSFEEINTDSLSKRR